MMKRKGAIKGFILLLILFVVMAGIPLYPGSSVQAMEYAVATLSNVHGEVTITKGGGQQEFEAFNGMKLTQGDGIRTGEDGFVTIGYEDGSETSLDANTQVRIEKLTEDTGSQQTSLKLLAGAVWNKVKSLLNIGDEYKVETPTAVLGVRGTLYHVSQDNVSGTGRGAIVEGQVKGQENIVCGFGLEQQVLAGQEFELGDKSGKKAQIKKLDINRIITRSQPLMLGQMLVDIKARLEELLDLSKKAQSAYLSEKDKDTLSLAIVLADQAKALAGFAGEFTTDIKESPKAEAVNKILSEQGLSLDKLQSGFNSGQSGANQLWNDLMGLAQDANLSKGKINSVLNQGFEASLYGKLMKEIAQQTPSNGSGGGSSGGSGGTNPPPVVPNLPVDNFSSVSYVDNGNKTATITMTVKNGKEEGITNLTAQDFIVKLRDQSYVVGNTPTFQGFTHIGNGVYEVIFNPGFEVNEVVEVVVKGVSIEQALNFVIGNPVDPDLPADGFSSVSYVDNGNKTATITMTVKNGKKQGITNLTARDFTVKLRDQSYVVGITPTFEGFTYKGDGVYEVIFVPGFAVNEVVEVLVKGVSIERNLRFIISDSGGVPSETKIKIRSTELASVSSEGIQGDDSSNESSISGDGQRVAFISYADNLVPNADKSTMNIYLHDSITGKTEQVNVNSNGVKVPGAMQPVISDNGRYVAFRSERAGLVLNDTNGDDDVFVRDIDKGITVRVSVGTDGTEAKGGSFGPGSPSISGDGRYVAFSSDDKTLVPGETSVQDIFVRDRDTDQNGTFDEDGGVSTSRISISTDGQPANNECYYPVISANGRFVAYYSNASNLVPGVTAGGIFARDLQENKTVYLVQGDSPDLSDDGRFVVFDAGDSSLLVPGDTNQKSDLFIMDRDADGNGVFDESGKTSFERVTLNAKGEQVNANCFGPKISGDGRYVTYYSSATNLIPGIADGNDHVYLYDRVTKQTKLLDATRGGSPANDASFYAAISSNGEYVTFTSDATNLVASDANGGDGDVFVVGLDLNSPVDKVPPVFGTGSGLEAEEIGPSWVKLTWGEATDNMLVTNYALYRGTAQSGPFSRVATLDLTNHNYWDVELSPDSSYYYYVLAGDEDGNWSAVPATATLIKTLAKPLVNPMEFPIAAGGNHSLARTEDGHVWAWGDNSDGQLGDGTTEEKSTPVKVLGPGGVGYLSGIAAIASQDNVSMALKSDGTVWAWGANDMGQLGIGTSDYQDHHYPVQVKGYQGQGFLTDVEAIASSEFFSLALKSDGTVWAWGDNFRGQLGDGTDADRLTPVPVKSPDGTGYLTDIIAIAAGDMHSVALKRDGTVWTWGQNSSGQLGNGVTDWDTHSLPRQVPGLSGVVTIATGQYHTLAIKADGSIWAWGENYYGEIGDGTLTKRNSPTRVLDENGSGYLSGVTSVTGGGYASFAIKDDQSVWAWGYNDYGQLGRPIASYKYLTPAQSAGLAGITHVAAGEEHMIALDRDGRIWGLGYNRFGQLGIGTNEWDGHPTPVQVIGFGNGQEPDPDPTPNPEAPIWLEGSTLTAPYVTPTSINLIWGDALDVGGIANYKIIMNGNALAPLPGVQHNYTVEGLTKDTSYTFKIEASDPQGNWSTNGPSVTVSTSSELLYDVIDPSGGAGRYSSLAFDSTDTPHVSYQDYNAGDPNLKYAYQMGGKWVTETVDSVGDLGLYSSLALDAQDRPHISYRDNGQKVGLKYAHYNGGTWEIERVSDVVPEFTTIKVDSLGNPHIVYNTSSYGSVEHAYKSDNKWITETIEQGVYPSMALDEDGYPHISYFDSNNNVLKYAYKDGSGWHKTTVDSSNNAGSFTSLALDTSGKAHISYIDYPNKKVKYAYEDQAGWHTETVGSVGSQGYSTSIAVDNSGKVYITYVQYTDYEHPLFYAFRDSAGWHNVVAHNGINKYFIEARPFIAVDSSGNIHICYYSTGLEYIHGGSQVPR